MDRGARELRFPAMGTDAHVVVVGGGPDLGRVAERRVAELETRWSRFLPDSELSRLNRAAGCLAAVSSDTYLAVELAVRAWRTTSGRFDPTVLPALVATGYDRSFDRLRPESAEPAPAGTGPAGPVPAWPAPGCGAIGLLPAVPGVVLPPGVALDLGGIGKGLAADLVVGELMKAGADGACVNLGGDLRVAGAAPTADGWVVGLEDPGDPGADLCRLVVSSGAVATSTTAKRRWIRHGEEHHHLIDPGTGRSSASGVRSATVVAGEAWLAEVLAKACLLDPDNAAALLDRERAAGLLVGDDGSTFSVGHFGRFVR